MHLLITMAATAALALGARADDAVVVGPGFVKHQVGARALVYRVPDGWREDAGAAREAGLTAVLLPAGKTLAQADAAITVAFQRKDARNPGLATLQGFFSVDVQNTLAQFPDTEPARWQPRALNPDVVTFMSLELRPKGPRASSPARVLFIDAGDGYYSVTLTASSVEALSDARYARFFDGVALR